MYDLFLVKESSDVYSLEFVAISETVPHVTKYDFEGNDAVGIIAQDSETGEVVSDAWVNDRHRRLFYRKRR